MKKVIYLIISVFFIANLTFAQDFKSLNNLSDKTIQELQELGDPSQIGPDGIPLYVKGMVYVKIKDGQIPIIEQYSKIKKINSFGISSLDAVGSKFGFSKIEPAFNLASSLSPRVKNRNLSLPKNNEALSSIYKVYFDNKYSFREVVKELTKLSEVAYAEPVPLYYILEVPNDPSYISQQHLPQMSCPQAWDIHKGQNGNGSVIIGICDSGIDWKHNDLIGNLYNNLGEDADKDGHTIEWNGSTWVFDPGDINGKDDDGNGFIDDFSGWNFWTADGTAVNNIMGSANNAHGTHCTGISAGVTNNSLGISSISWNLKFIGTKHGDNRSGNAIYNGFDGIVYLAQNGADVVNCSWGGSGYSATGQTAINYATSLGCIVVCAAGNNNSGNAFYPAAYDNVVSVASVAVNDKKAYYSNYGYTVDVSAPGGDAYVDGGILSTIPGNNYAKFQGTSMAAPQVTGIIGYVKSFLPTISNDALIRRILGNADPVDPLNPGYVGKLGYGRINAHKSLLFESTAKLPMKLVTNGIYYEKVFDYYKISFDVSNYSMDGANQVKFELTTSNPNIQILSSYGYGPILGNNTTITDYFVAFRILNPNPSWATLNLHMTGVDNSILAGADYSFDVYCGNNATLVYEKVNNAPTTSGKYIKDYLVNNNYPNVVYTNSNITNLIGFNYVFLSMGNADASEYATLDKIRVEAIKKFLQAGGKLYIESGDGLGYEQAGNYEFLSLFGIAEGYDGIASHTFAGLQGGVGTITEGMNFTSTTQSPRGWIDYFTLNTGKIGFNEPGYGIVGVQNTGSYGQKTFAFSYAMSKLTDAAAPSTKLIFLQKLLSFLGLYNQLPAAVQLNTPANNQIIYTNSNVVFSWLVLSNTWDYELQISRFNDFRNTLFSGTLEQIQKTFLSSDFMLNNNYFWRVRGRNNLGLGPWSEIRSFRIQEEPPAKTILSYPANGSTVNTLRPTFQWIKPDRANSYTFEISKSSDFTVGYQKYAGISTTSFYLYVPLSHNSTYYWRVTAHNQGGSGPVSDVWSFKPYICAIQPTLNSPANGATNQEWKLILKWNAVQYANSYNLQISADPNFQNLMDYTGITTISKQITSGLSPNKTYYWRVRSTNDCGFSEFSAVRSFTTKTAPFEINLINKATCSGVNVDLGLFSGQNLITVTGGSGSFQFTWNPNYEMINAATGNPTVINPSSTKTYTLTVKDLVTNTIKSKSMILTVYNPLYLQLPQVVYLTVGNSLNLNNQISSLSGGNPPYTMRWYDATNKLINPPIISPSVGYYKYKLIVTDANNCTITGNLYVMVTSMRAGLSENAVIGNNGTSILISYPNPVNDLLNFTVYSNEDSQISYEILDLIGRKHLSGNLGNYQSIESSIDLQNLPSGTYIFNVFVGEGLISKKIIKK